MKTTHFDPADQETKELVYSKETTPDMYTEDTNADPEGVAARVVHTADYPAYLFDTFRLDENGKLAPRSDVVETALTYYNAYGESDYVGEDADKFKEEVDAGVTCLRTFFVSSHTGSNGNAQRPSQGMLYSFAGAANRLVADWCLDRRTYDDLCSKGSLSDNQIKFHDDLSNKIPAMGRAWRMSRDILYHINAEFGTDFEINADQVKKAIFNNLKRLADYHTNRSRPVNVQQQADSAREELNARIAATF
tara:strand:- start:737 stop:1483 length:747 start_codon:yes stop_codon:yes gene_type:complete